MASGRGPLKDARQADDDDLAIAFRCPSELEGLLPAPIPASQALPHWLRSMPQQATSISGFGEDDTVKRCPPFVDAMTCGFMIPLMCDVQVDNGEFSWDWDLPVGGSIEYPRSPLGLHDSAQVSGTPFFDTDRCIIKFHNLWTIEAPPGYSLLFTHPVDRFDLPFTTLTGLVDCDRYHEVWINFPALWRDEAFSGVLLRGTPVAQVIPVKRANWVARISTLTPEDTGRAHDLLADISKEPGVYRRRFRA